ncbi:Hypothetical protein PENO1_086230 [Penicillium occitanis (nom. inval.)]|nr:Hypothetical protein PENO1_086230 [Penicillium occitanis (nom. inval.)]PCG96946.1 hypothetical protein PENOC_070310 [Penicillium occitanis (nom. inval.)]
MTDLNKGLVQPFLGALQACTSVLLTLLYGVITRQANLINDETINEMSVWSILYTLLSFGIGHTFSRCMRLPTWVTPAVTFNNTSSLPLLLLQTLQSTGSLKLITMPGQSESDCMNRAQSYFLVCAVASNTIAYAIGPRMLSRADSSNKKDDQGGRRDQGQAGVDVSAQPQEQFRHNTIAPIPENGGDNEEGEEADERTSLLPKPIQKARHTLSAKTRHLFSYLPRPVRRRIDALDSPFLDTAILCTATGMLLGLVPKLHRAFFSSYEDGGVFNAWLVSSIENVGALFTSLQVFLVGCKLGVSFERMKRSSSPSSPDEGLEEEAGGSGRVPIRAIVVVYTVRLILWPIISILTTYLIIRYTSIIPHDPVLWYTLMVIPTGPPALLISGLAELSDDVTKGDKMAIAKMLAVRLPFSTPLE